MTYAQFLLVILLPLVAAAAAVLAFRLRRSTTTARPALPRSVAVMALALPVIALVYTTPWDSWLICNSVWGYPPGTITATAFGVPLEEYIFMVGTTVITGCWTLGVSVGLSSGSGRDTGTALGDGHVRRRVRAAGLWLAAGGAGAVAAAVESHALYGGSQLAWFAPPLALQAVCGADILRASWRLRIVGLATTPVLWAADAVGIRTGAWYIGTDSTVGLRLLGVLPLEEATFFLLVNLLIVNSVVLCLDPLMQQRIGRFTTGITRPADAWHPEQDTTTYPTSVGRHETGSNGDG
jgi:lycopene beta-cyclase